MSLDPDLPFANANGDGQAAMLGAGLGEASKVVRVSDVVDASLEDPHLAVQVGVPFGGGPVPIGGELGASDMGHGGSVAPQIETFKGGRELWSAVCGGTDAAPCPLVDLVLFFLPLLSLKSP